MIKTSKGYFAKLYYITPLYNFSRFLLIEANFTIILENIGFSDLIGANFAIGYNI